ncbi:MAG: flagellar hook assembly protein FlgD [Bdellovibrionales bacterium]
MLGVKTGTQTWSNSVQRTDFKSDGNQTISATDRQKHLQDENIGEILNKVADPNYVDESKKMRTVGNNQLNKDAFMSLLLTQMKNQDPTNPLKSHEMAAQLAQFTSLEKLHNINEAIDGLRKDQQPDHNFQALNFIGKTISTDNSKISRVEPNAQHDIRFDLPNDAQKLTLKIKDAAGTLIRTLEFNNMKSGKNELNWNGLTDDGRQAPVGEYTAVIDAIGSNGRKLGVETKTEGVISGVNFTARGPQLLIGKQIVNLSEVKSISDPGLQRTAEDLQVQQNVKPKAGPIPIVKAETKENSEKAEKLVGGNLNDAAMAQDFINKLNKEGAKAGGMGS